MKLILSKQRLSIFFFTTTVLLGSSILVVSAKAADAPNDSQVKELLDLSLKTSRFPESYYYHLQTELRHIESSESTTMPSRVDGEINMKNVYKDQARLDVANVMSLVKGPTSQPNNVNRAVWNGHEYVARIQSVGSSPASLIVVMSKDPRRIERFCNDYTFARYLDGIIFGDDKPAVAILVEAGTAMNKGQELVGEDMCTLIEGKTTHGYYKVWLDNARGYVMRKASVRRSAGDLEFGSVISSGNQADCLVDQLKVESFGAGTIGISGQENIKYLKGGIVTDEQEFKATRSRLSTNPDFVANKAFQLQNIPNGTPVQVFDDVTNHFSYIWENGEVVKDEDKSALKEIDRAVQGEKDAVQKNARH